MSNITLGNLTKQILSDIGYDTVSNISETEDSLQVARIVRSTYQEMIARFKLPVERALFQLDATGTATPTTLVLPSNIGRMDIFNYDKRESFSDPIEYLEVEWCEPHVFLDRANKLSTVDSNVVATVLPSGVTIHITNDAHPSYWTSFDNKNIICNSYLATVDDNLQNSKCQCYGEVDNTVSLEDDAVIPLDNKLEPLLLNTARAKASQWLKQVRDTKSEDMQRRLENKATDEHDRQGGPWRYPGYGR